VSQNGVLDYFGSTVNLAARIVGISTGDDIVLSEAVRSDPEVTVLGLDAKAIDGTLRDFEDETPLLWQVRT
jgi:class 3 adenylate cyclase